MAIILWVAEHPITGIPCSLGNEVAVVRALHRGGHSFLSGAKHLSLLSSKNLHFVNIRRLVIFQMELVQRIFTLEP